MYFYHLLKPLAEISLTDDDFVDWGHEQEYVQAIGVGECAGIMLDMVTTIINEASEKHIRSQEELSENLYADSIYNSYNTFVIGAKAVLLSVDVQCNTQAGIIRDFNEKMVKSGRFVSPDDFEELVYRINKNEPRKEFAMEYHKEAGDFLRRVRQFRKEQLEHNPAHEKDPVISNHYKA